MTDEDADLAFLRMVFTGWSVAVDDGRWEARPRARLREDETLTATSAQCLAWKLLHAERK